MIEQLKGKFLALPVIAVQGDVWPHALAEVRLDIRHTLGA